MLYICIKILVKWFLSGDGDECYFCSVCSRKTHKYSTYLKHVRTHKDMLVFSCAVCQESFHAPCLLRYHIDLQHSHVMPFQCRRCLRRFKLKCSLSTHLRYCDVDPGSLPFAEEMQFIDQLSQQRYCGSFFKNNLIILVTLLSQKC